MSRTAFVALLALTGCASGDRKAVSTPPPPVPSVATGWREGITREDLTRLHGWREAFVTALQQARTAGSATAITREGKLLDPDAALDQPLPPPGSYRCRVIKLGMPNDGTLPYIAYPAFTCSVAQTGATLQLAKLTGSQRPTGTIYPDTTRRGIFLGTLLLGDEQRAMRYGRDNTRDLAGAVERVGERRWRLILPYPRFESLIDVIELVPDP